MSRRAIVAGLVALIAVICATPASAFDRTFDPNTIPALQPEPCGPLTPTPDLFCGTWTTDQPVGPGFALEPLGAITLVRISEADAVVAEDRPFGDFQYDPRCEESGHLHYRGTYAGSRSLAEPAGRILACTRGGNTLYGDYRSELDEDAQGVFPGAQVRSGDFEVTHFQDALGKGSFSGTIGQNLVGLVATWTGSCAGSCGQRAPSSALGTSIRLSPRATARLPRFGEVIALNAPVHDKPLTVETPTLTDEKTLTMLLGVKDPALRQEIRFTLALVAGVRSRTLREYCLDLAAGPRERLASGLLDADAVIGLGLKGRILSAFRVSGQGVSDRAYLSYAACMATVDRAVEAAGGAGTISSTAAPAAGAVLSATSACRRGVTPLAVRATSSGGARVDVLRSAPPAPLKVTCTRRADGRMAVRLVSRTGPLRRIVGPRLRIGALRPSDTPGGGLITFRFDRG